MGSSEPESLSGLRLLVVRPEREDDTFLEAVSRRGATVHHLPVIAIEPLLASAAHGVNTPGRDTLADAADSAEIIIVVSRPAAMEAVRLFLRQELIPPLLVAVGASTAAILSEAGFKVCFPTQNPTSEGVLALPQLQQVNGRKVLILRGEGGRDTLRQVLTERGAEVAYGNLYRRKPIATHGSGICQLLDSAAVDVVVLHSVETLHSLLALCTETALARLAELLLLVPGQRVAEAAKNVGLNNLLVADSALPEAMVQSLVGWYTARHSGV